MFTCGEMEQIVELLNKNNRFKSGICDNVFNALENTSLSLLDFVRGYG
jgi:hypothetical protein